MAFLHHKLTRRVLLILILLWSLLSFWYLNPLMVARVIISILGLIGLFFIIYETTPIYILILISFTASYALYGFFYRLMIPTWQIMLAILILFGYIFTYVEQKIGILGNKRLLYLILFALIVLEVFLSLSYFLINPLSQSLIISTICYLFSGFCFTILAHRQDIKFSTYLITGTAVLLAIFLSSTWSI